MDQLQTEKGHQGCILSLCLFNLYAEYITQNARLDEAQAGIKIARKNINNLRDADDTTLMAKSEEALKSILKEVKEENEIAGLKLNIQKKKKSTFIKSRSWPLGSHHFMANKWGNNGHRERLYFLGLQKSLWMVIAVMKLKDACSFGKMQ